MKNLLKLLGVIVPAAIAGFSLTGCASTPAVFETAGSLAGTYWVGLMESGGEKIYRKVVLTVDDAASGVFTTMEGRKIPFTYQAVYGEKNRSFTGTLTPEDGAAGDFSVIKGGPLGWLITAPGLGLNNAGFNYRSPESLQKWAAEESRMAVIAEQYGGLISGLSPEAMATRLIREGREFHIWDGSLSTIRAARGETDNVGANILAASTVSYRFALHSKDGVTVTLTVISGGNDTGTVAGSFSLSRSGDTVSISGGSGEGAQYEGDWEVWSSGDE